MPLMGPTSNGKVTKIHNLPGAETGPGGAATWGRATVDRADAFGFKWDRSGNQQAHRLRVAWSGLKPSLRRIGHLSELKRERRQSRSNGFAT